MKHLLFVLLVTNSVALTMVHNPFSAHHSTSLPLITRTNTHQQEEQITGNTKTIIWGFDGVLYKPNNFKIAIHELGLRALIAYTVLDRKNPFKLKKRSFQVLYELGCQEVPDDQKLITAEGLELPQLMVDVLIGTMPAEKALEQSTVLIETLWQERAICSKYEKKLLLAFMHTLFDPQTVAKYLRALPQSAKLIASCAQDPFCAQYVLANCEEQAFARLHASAEGHKIFTLIPLNNITLSSVVKLAKPDPELFKLLIARHNLNPSECLLVDDTLESVLSAQACGFDTIYSHGKSHSELQELLIRRGYIENPRKHSTKRNEYDIV